MAPAASRYAPHFSLGGTAFRPAAPMTRFLLVVSAVGAPAPKRDETAPPATPSGSPPRLRFAHRARPRSLARTRAVRARRAAARGAWGYRRSARARPARRAASAAARRPPPSPRPRWWLASQREEDPRQHHPDDEHPDDARHPPAPRRPRRHAVDRHHHRLLRRDRDRRDHEVRALRHRPGLAVACSAGCATVMPGVCLMSSSLS